jgi:DHA3 family macrolide efflux protein-like MFS transporter
METSPRALRGDGNFRLYLSARVISQLGDQLYIFAISWFVLDLTKSSLQMAALLAVNALAVMAVAPLGGLVADRASRKAVMVVTDLVQGAVLVALFALQHLGLLTLAALYAGTIVLGVCAAVFTPAASAIVPGIVRRELVPAAVAAGQAAQNFCTIAGMLLGGAMYAVIGIGGVLVVNGVSFFIAAGMEAAIRTGAAVGAEPQVLRAGGPAAGPASPGFARELLNGLRTVRRDRQVFALLLVNTVFTLAALPIAMVYTPYLFNVVLRASSIQAAFPQAAIWAGIIFGSAIAARMMRRSRPEILIAGGLLALAAHSLLMAGLMAASGLLGDSGMSAACTVGNAVAGAASALFTVPLYALFHARTVEAFRGRFWGLEGALRTGAMCLGYFGAGVLAQRLPLGAIFVAVGIVFCSLGVVVMRLHPSPVMEEPSAAVW